MMSAMRKAQERYHNPLLASGGPKVSGRETVPHTLKRESGFFDTRKGKRSLEEMVESLGGDPVKEAAYVLERVYNIEKSIVNVLMAVSDKGRAIAYQRRPSLKRYH